MDKPIWEKRNWVKIRQKSLRNRFQEQRLQQLWTKILWREVEGRLDEDVWSTIGSGISPFSSKETNGARLDWVGKLGR